MTLALALNNAISGLRVNQQSISVLSQNIANVNTEGYSRQVINQSAVTIEGVGSGVQIDEITRKIDKYLQRSMQTQSSVNATAQTLSDYYQRVQNLLGQPGAGNSIDTFLTGFFNSMQQLAESPEATSLKSNAISAAGAIAKQVSDLAANIYDLRFEADREIGDAVSTINASLDRLFNLNIALTRAKSAGQSVAGLLDQRDRELSTLSEYVNISTNIQESGAVGVVAGDGLVLLEEGVKHKLSYIKASSAAVFEQDQPLNALEVLTTNVEGEEIGTPAPMMLAGRSADVVSKVSGGKLDALQQLRDVKFPSILEQLDQLASKLRDEVNTIHNSGSGFPPATSLTGDRAVFPSDQYSWEGSVRIAVLQASGKPVPSRYADETYTGIRALTLDLSRLDSGQGNGKPTMQTIVDEINNHFGAPGNRVTLGNLNNIQIASDTQDLPGGSPVLFNFDIDAENISDNNARIFVTGATVLDDTATNITSVTQAAPGIAIQPIGSYTTTLGSADVTINLASAPNVVAGDTIYLNAPTAAVNGITVPQLTGFFTVTAVSGSTLTFTSGGVAAATGSVNDAGGIQMMEPYNTIGVGQQERSRDKGQMQLDFTANPTSAYYDVTLNVTVIGEDDVQYTAPVTYRVPNNQSDIYNKRYNATAVGAPATLVLPSSSQESLRAILVDADGNELPTINGKYVDTTAYLKIVGGNAAESFSVAIDDLDSAQVGKPDDSPAQEGTNWGFSHYFGLNNFFESNDPTTTGDTLHNSALNLRVQSRLLANADLLSIGTLAQQSKNDTTNNLEVYTYARFAGDNSIAQQMAKLNTQVLSFDAAGGLAATELSLQSYTSVVLGYVSQKSSEAKDNAVNAQTIFDGFKSKADSISSVNLDEELANTITFQNAYSATARIITTVNKMYEELMQAF